MCLSPMWRAPKPSVLWHAWCLTANESVVGMSVCLLRWRPMRGPEEWNCTWDLQLRNCSVSGRFRPHQSHFPGLSCLNSEFRDPGRVIGPPGARRGVPRLKEAATPPIAVDCTCVRCHNGGTHAECTNEESVLKTTDFLHRRTWHSSALSSCACSSFVYFSWSPALFGGRSSSEPLLTFCRSLGLDSSVSWCKWTFWLEVVYLLFCMDWFVPLLQRRRHLLFGVRHYRKRERI